MTYLVLKLELESGFQNKLSYCENETKLRV